MLAVCTAAQAALPFAPPQTSSLCRKTSEEPESAPSLPERRQHFHMRNLYASHSGYPFLALVELIAHSPLSHEYSLDTSRLDGPARRAVFTQVAWTTTLESLSLPSAAKIAEPNSRLHFTLPSHLALLTLHIHENSSVSFLG